MSMNKRDGIYQLWVVMAVQGVMAHADQFLRQYKSDIYAVARKLSYSFPKSLEVYRGVLLTPEQVLKGEKTTIKEKYPVEFISFTEDIDVACWFAHPKSVMSSYVSQIRPNSEGYVIEHQTQPREVLFYHQWHQSLGIENNLPWIEKNLMANGINTDLSQYLHNIETQFEVILKPIEKAFDLIPLAECCQTSVEELDQKLTHANFRRK